MSPYSLKLQLKNLLKKFLIIKITLPVIVNLVFSALTISFVKLISFIPIYLLDKSLSTLSNIPARSLNSYISGKKTQTRFMEVINNLEELVEVKIFEDISFAR